MGGLTVTPISTLHRQAEARSDDRAFLPKREAWTYGPLARTSEQRRGRAEWFRERRGHYARR
jgi:hypothetical protein